MLRWCSWTSLLLWPLQHPWFSSFLPPHKSPGGYANFPVGVNEGVNVALGNPENIHTHFSQNRLQVNVTLTRIKLVINKRIKFPFTDCVHRGGKKTTNSQTTCFLHKYWDVPGWNLVKEAGLHTLSPHFSHNLLDIYVVRMFFGCFCFLFF